MLMKNVELIMAQTFHKVKWSQIKISIELRDHLVSLAQEVIHLYPKKQAINHKVWLTLSIDQQREQT
jgi:hypothetical protein